MTTAAGSPFTEALVSEDATSEYPARMRRFGQLVGSWAARGHRLDEATGEWHDREFTWIVAFILDGRAVQDIEVVETEQGKRETVATGVRVYDPLAGAWRVSFFSPKTGEYCHLIATSYRGGIRQDGTQTDERPIRWNFSEITADSYVWDGWVSNDGGSNWELTEHVEATRIT
ncbi:hypothetical protein [Luethyella okanaganae]|uniref:DUF1579 domain-containing protein n=1 Tax=Luethyella okanaganae TaxID=69372 RepID=A0ABW1VEJ7_9MICO